MKFVDFCVAILAICVSVNFRIASSIKLRVQEFSITPKYPTFGDNVSFTCRLIAPLGHTFYRTEPWLAFDLKSEKTYSPYRVGREEIPGVDIHRFTTERNPDVNRVNESVTVLITNFSLADVGMKISCINRLHLRLNAYQDVMVNGILKLAASPPAPTNLLISFPTNKHITCHSPLSVSWDRVPTSLTNRTIEGYRVSFLEEDKWRIFSPTIRNSSIQTMLNFAAKNSTVQARINCWSQAGNSSTALSNRLQIYHPEIRNLTVRVEETAHILHLKWEFSPHTSSWLLDIGYELSLVYSSANHTESTFSTTVTLLSNINQFNLHYQIPLGSRIKLVTLTKYHICNQNLRYLDRLTTVPIDSPSTTTTSSLSTNTKTSEVPTIHTSHSSNSYTSQPPKLSVDNNTLTTIEQKLPLNLVYICFGLMSLSVFVSVSISVSCISCCFLIGYRKIRRKRKRVRDVEQNPEDNPDDHEPDLEREPDPGPVPILVDPIPLPQDQIF